MLWPKLGYTLSASNITGGPALNTFLLFLVPTAICADWLCIVDIAECDGIALNCTALYCTVGISDWFMSQDGIKHASNFTGCPMDSGPHTRAGWRQITQEKIIHRIRTKVEVCPQAWIQVGNERGIEASERGIVANCAKRLLGEALHCGKLWQKASGRGIALWQIAAREASERGNGQERLCWQADGWHSGHDQPPR